MRQGRHNAPKYSGLNGDILNFAIYAPKSGASSSVLRMFSLSRIHGALGDNGQNYKSLQLGSREDAYKDPPNRHSKEF